MRDGGTRSGHGAVRLGCLGAHAAAHGRLHAWANPPDPDHIPLSGSPVSDLDA